MQKTSHLLWMSILYSFFSFSLSHGFKQCHPLCIRFKKLSSAEWSTARMTAMETLAAPTTMATPSTW